MAAPWTNLPQGIVLGWAPNYRCSSDGNPMTLSYISILLWSYLTVSDTHISFPHGDQSVARLAKADYIVNLAAGVCPIYTYIPLASGYESL